MKLEQCHVGKMVRMESWGQTTPSEKIIWCDWASVVLEHPDGSRHMYFNHCDWLLDEPKKKYGLIAYRLKNSHDRWRLETIIASPGDLRDSNFEYHFPVKFDADGYCELPE